MEARVAPDRLDDDPSTLDAMDLEAAVELVRTGYARRVIVAGLRLASSAANLPEAPGVSVQARLDPAGLSIVVAADEGCLAADA